MTVQKQQFIDFLQLTDKFDDLVDVNADEFTAEPIQEEYHLLSLIHPDKRKYTTFAKFVIENSYPILRNLVVSFENNENATKGILTKYKKHYLPRKVTSY